MAVRFRSCGPAFLFWVGTACSAPSPIPEEVASELPPERELDPETKARLASLTVEALRLLGEERFDEAEETARQALSLQPREARPRAVLGTCLMNRARQTEPPDLHLWRRAEGELLAATRTAPSDPIAAVLYGQFLVGDGHLTAAAEVAEATLRHDPDDLAALRLAAETRYELGEERVAIPHLERWMQLDPDPQIRYKLAWCLLRIAESDREDRVPLLVEAAESFAAYRELEPEDSIFVRVVFKLLGDFSSPPVSGF